MTGRIKVWLFKTLGLERYLRLLQWLFITGYTTGILKASEKYKWHYFVKKLVRPTDTVLDIGANLGYFSIVFSKIIGNTGRLYSIEPVKPYRDLLEKKLPRKSNITVYPFALGNTNEGPVKLGMPPMLQHLQYLRHGTVTILSGEAADQGHFVFESSIRKAGEVFAGLQQLDYIKCDIEGYETVVFPEMKAILQQHKPLVQLETWGEQVPVMLHFFKALGYTAYHLEAGKLVNCEAMTQNEIGASDILFVPQERLSIAGRFMQ